MAEQRRGPSERPLVADILTRVVRLTGVRSRQYPADVVGLVEMAETEARDRRHPYLVPSHLVLAALGHSEGRFAKACALGGVNRRRAYQRVSEFVSAEVGIGSGPRHPEEVGRLPCTNRFSRMLDDARHEARREGALQVELLHVMVALLRAGLDPIDLLDEEGITLSTVLPGAGAGTAPQPLRFVISISDESDLPIHSQIIEQVREAVATRRLAPDDRLPSVRHLADRLGIAPGTVARAYSDLERDGVVATLGTLGTRIAPRRGRDEKPAGGAALAVSEALRRIVVRAYHDGLTADDLRSALNKSLNGIY